MFKGVTGSPGTELAMRGCHNWWQSGLWK